MNCRAAAWGGSLGSAGRQMLRSKTRLEGEVLPRRILVHTGPGGGRGVLRGTRGLRGPTLGCAASWDGRPVR
eukprot:12319114-Alexandrium_andersonii.AAC.1